MKQTRKLLAGMAACTFFLLGGAVSFAQDTIKIGELSSYKNQPAFLEPYRKGWQLALEEVNASGGVLGKKLEVISRDDGVTPGDAVRVAEELRSREGVQLLAGTFFSHIGLAITEYAGEKRASSSQPNR